MSGFKTTSMRRIEEQELERQYLEKYVKYSPVGRTPIHGMITRISRDNIVPGNVVFMIQDKRYEEDEESLSEVLEIL